MAEQDSSPQHSKQSRSKRVPIIVGLIILVLIGAGIGYWFSTQQNSIPEERPIVEMPEENVQDTTVEPGRVENPIDFATLQADNSDIYAWISIPGTKIDYPICQSLATYNFYLDHDEYGNYSDAGAIYTESNNTKTFYDPVTVIYGHTGYGDTMFGTLHYFDNPEFFDSHEYFTIYTPGHILTYRVVSAYMYDDRHILNSFDFAKEEVLEEYQNFVLNPTSLDKNVREGIVLTPNDKIVQLSTCMTDLSLATNRYLLTGMLVEDQLTY